MDDGAHDRDLDAARRPHTPHAIELLKAIRYEQAVDGLPPVHVRSINPPSRPLSAPRSLETITQKRSTNFPTSALSKEVKRDSAIAPSVSTTDRASYAESRRSSAVAGAAREPALPTIKVQDDESPEAIVPDGSPFRAKKAQTRERATRSLSPPVVRRSHSFRGIQAEIPQTSADGIDLKDLASDKVCFSQRGSLLLGGKKMNELVGAQSDGAAHAKPVVPAAEDPAREEEPRESTPPATEAAEAQAAPATPVRGLVTGRRKPSVHMLQALQGGRVLSAEEIGFSMKVRSMYEHGDERAADWYQALGYDSSGKNTPNSLPRGGSVLGRTGSGIAVAKTRQSGAEQPAVPVSQSDVRASYTKDVSEIAGGIEDWNAVNGNQVDRYGFINSQRISSRLSVPSPGQTEGLQRVATTLRVEGDQPRSQRKLKRGLSNARSSRSVRPLSIKDGSPTSLRRLRSVRSARPRSSSVRSKDRKTLAAAADMLTLPPGLTGIPEQDDGGRTASIFKRREWSRGEKWQKMARPIREGAANRGGGMRFVFDTTDPKLVSRTWKGIPDRWRATAWHNFLAQSAQRRGPHASDGQLIDRFHQLQEASSADDVQIDVDVPRTISMHIMFRRRYRGGQRLLFRVLHAVSLYFPDVGYVQGMASLAATLLCYFDEEQAFVMMVRLWQLRGLRQLFQSGFEGLMAALAEFNQEWLGEGDVARKLADLGIDATAYGTRWYLTLFNMSLPFPAQLRIWDVFMLLGDATVTTTTPTTEMGNGNEKDFGGADLDVLHAAGAALIDATRDIVLEGDFENVMKVLTSFIPIRDEDLLMRVTWTEWRLRKRRAGMKV